LDERERFVRGTFAGALLVSAAVAGILLLSGRPAWAVAFATGAGISLLNFRLIAVAVGRLGAAEPQAGWRGLWRGSLIRFGLAAGLLVLALVVLRLALLPLVAGLLAAQVWMVGQWLRMALRESRQGPGHSGG
jgi:hypothetical protein